MKYSKNFERDFAWYLKMRHVFTFSGDYLRTKNGDVIHIEKSRQGISGKECFLHYDSSGKLLPTKHPNIVQSVLKAKASANFHIKELYAKDRANGFLSGIELEEIYEELKPPEWFKNAVSEWVQKYKNQKSAHYQINYQHIKN